MASKSRRHCPATWAGGRRRRPPAPRPSMWPSPWRRPRVGPISALAAVSSSTASPAAISTICGPLVGLAIERDRPFRFHRVVSRAQPDVDRAIRPGDDPSGRRGGRVVADEQRMARDGRRLWLGAGENHPYVEDALRLTGGRVRQDEEERRERERADHGGPSSSPRSADVNAAKRAGGLTRQAPTSGSSRSRKPISAAPTPPAWARRPRDAPAGGRP